MSPKRASATAEENSEFSNAKRALNVFREARYTSEKEVLEMGSTAGSH